MDESEFYGLMQLGEGRSLEFKQSTPWENAEFKAKIVKSILAFSNVIDGGRIVVGVEQQNDGGFNPKGMTDEHLSTWNYDEIASYASEFADLSWSFRWCACLSIQEHSCSSQYRNSKKSRLSAREMDMLG